MKYRYVKGKTRKIKAKLSKKKIKAKLSKLKNKTCKGGSEFLGNGTFGVVIGNPRLPCKEDDGSIEPYTEEFDNEISKIFKLNSDAINEEALTPNLQKYMPQDDYTEFINYAILSKKVCKVPEELNPITKPDNNETKSDNNETKSDNNEPDNNETKSDFNKYNITNYLPIVEVGEDEYTTMSIQPKAKPDLYVILTDQIDNINSWIISLIKLYSILKAILLLQKNNMCHLDIKPQNIMNHNNMYKLIDNDTIMHIDKTTTTLITLGYFPSIFIYNRIIPMNLTHDLTHDLFNTYYTKYIESQPPQPPKIESNGVLQSETTNRLTTYTPPPRLIPRPKHLNIFILSQINDAIADENIFKMLNSEFTITKNNIFKQIINQQTFGEKTFKASYNFGPPEDPVNYPTTIKELNSMHLENNSIPLQKNDPNYSTQEFIKKNNKIVESFVNSDEAKRDIYKRNDIYAFGILLLYHIQILHVVEQQIPTKTGVKHQYILNIYKELSEIIYLCCVQDRRSQTEIAENIINEKCKVIDINLICRKYADLIRPLLDRVTFSGNNTIRSELGPKRETEKPEEIDNDNNISDFKEKYSNLLIKPCIPLPPPSIFSRVSSIFGK